MSADYSPAGTGNKARAKEATRTSQNEERGQDGGWSDPPLSTALLRRVAAECCESFIFLTYNDTYYLYSTTACDISLQSFISGKVQAVKVCDCFTGWD